MSDELVIYRCPDEKRPGLPGVTYAVWVLALNGVPLMGKSEAYPCEDSRSPEVEPPDELMAVGHRMEHALQTTCQFRDRRLKPLAAIVEGAGVKLWVQ